MKQEDDKNWHQAKVTVISIIIGLTVQFGSIIWWGASISNDITTLKSQIQPVTSLTERIIKLEVQQSEVGKVVDKLNQTLERLDDTITAVAKQQAVNISKIEKLEKK